MLKKRYAAIDIGTNTILMLIAEKIDDSFKVLTDEHSIARLGEGIGINENHKIILSRAKDRAIEILNNYKDIYNQYNVQTIKVVATSALRDAQNKDEIIVDLEKAIGCKIDIITGIDEARFSYFGSVDSSNVSAVIDIGGGSTEIIYGGNNNILQRKSLQIGAVRMTEKYLGTNPISETSINSAKSEIKNQLNIIPKNIQTDLLYAVAGTPTNLAAIDMGLIKFDEKFIQGYILTIEKIKQIFNNFKLMTTKQINQKYGINPLRADVITAGTLILIESMEYLGFDKCTVSTKGLRYGVMKSLIKIDK